MKTCILIERATFREIATEHGVGILKLTCWLLSLTMHQSAPRMKWHPYLLANLVVGFDMKLPLLGEIGNVVDLPAGRVVIDADVGCPTGEVAGGADDAGGVGGRAAQDGEAWGKHGCVGAVADGPAQ